MVRGNARGVSRPFSRYDMPARLLRPERIAEWVPDLAIEFRVMKGGWLPVPHLGIELGSGTRVTGGTVEVPGLTIAHEGHHTVISVEEALERGWARRVK